MTPDGPIAEGTEFALEEERLDGCAVLTLAGEVDLHTAPQLREALKSAIDEGARLVVVDLSSVTFIDSMTLGVLLGAMKRLRPLGGRLQLVAPDRAIRRIFEITLLDRVFQLFETREAALAADGGGASLA